MEKLPYSIESFLRTGLGQFDPLALELFAYQFEKNRPYQAYCRLQGVTPEQVSRWQDIPAVPIGAFKSTELATFPVGQAAAIFESSGTTQGTKSRHFLKTLSYYEASLKSGFSKAVLPDDVKLPFAILAPSPAEAPRSSLSWMLDVVRRKFGSPGSVFVVQRGRLDELWLATLLAKAEETKEPMALLGTTVSFLSFFDYAAKARKMFRLPPGSRVLDTGGMKTSRREITRREFVQQVGGILGVPEDQCINEYGMCEMGSQFYGRGASAYLEGPAWTRTLVINPDSGLPVPDGRPGLLRHFDLSNVDSVLAIQTEDVGVAEGNGFVLQGRDPSADVKGCSLSAEAFL